MDAGEGQGRSIGPDGHLIPSDTGSFGPNAWFVEDMFERFRADPASVSESWREFFTDYRPAVPTTGQTSPTAAAAAGDGADPSARRSTITATVSLAVSSAGHSHGAGDGDGPSHDHCSRRRPIGCRPLAGRR